MATSRRCILLEVPVQPSPSRLEAFSDGVIAVIITIMVLELKVPHGEGLAGFVTILPTLGVYLLSFVFTGIYWVNHHHLVDRLKRVDALILWTNLGFLFCLSLLPFFTGYLVEKHLDSFSVAIYAGSLLLTGIAFTALQRCVVYHLRHTAAEPEELAQQLAEGRKGRISLTMYLVAIPLAYVHPPLALAVVAFITLVWIIPTFGIRAQAGPR